jgi:hypothetical protein
MPIFINSAGINVPKASLPMSEANVMVLFNLCNALAILNPTPEIVVFTPLKGYATGKYGIGN